jgi:hypothetical protein
MNDINNLVKHIQEFQRRDFEVRKGQLKKLYSKAERFEQLVDLRDDWASKRIKSLINHAERLGIVLKDAWRTEQLQADYKGLKIEGHLRYEVRGTGKRFTIWTRPRIALRFWFVDREGNRTNIRAVALLFGRKRLMVYNNLMKGMLDIMGR